MKGSVRLLAPVPDDLRTIRDYLAASSPDVADRFLGAVRTTFALLAAHPHAGGLKQFRDRRLADVRIWPITGFDNYVVLYRPEATGIRVLAVFYGARNLRKNLRERVR